MGISRHGSTPPDAVTPICSDCGVFLCWDIGEDEYEADRAFWDAWICESCNDGPFTKKAFYRNASSSTRTTA